MPTDPDGQRPLPARRSLPHGTPTWVKNGSLYFLTVCGQPRGENQFCHPEVANAIFETVAHRHAVQDWFMRIILLMPDHLHALISFPNDSILTVTVRQWKSYVARRHGIRWQRDFFEHRLRHDESTEQKADYLRQNPVRAGLVAQAEEWRYVWEPER